MSPVKAPKTLNELISDNHSINSLSLYRQKSEVFIKIQHILVDIFGDNIAQNIVVSNYKNSIVYLETYSAAVSTGFKMQQSQVLSTLRKQLSAAIVTVEMKVTPNSTRTGSKVKEVLKEQQKIRPKKHIPEHAAALFNEIAQRAEGKLKDKLLKLSKHNSQQNNEEK